MKFFKKNNKADKIILSILDNKISIELEINSANIDLSKHISQLLYSMNSGKLEDSFIDMLVEHSDKNPQHYKLIEQIIVDWVKLKHSNTSKDLPYISPTQVFSE